MSYSSNLISYFVYRNSLLLISIWFCTIQFCSILFWSVVYYPVSFHFILLYSTNWSVVFCSVQFNSVLFCYTLFYSILIYSTLFFSKGGYGSVFKAWDLLTSTTVAVKLIDLEGTKYMNYHLICILYGRGKTILFYLFYLSSSILLNLQFFLSFLIIFPLPICRSINLT